MEKKFARPVRKHEIQFRRSLFRFIITFALVVITGLVTRVFLSQLPIKDKILENLKLPESYSLNMDQVEPTFRSGLTPIVGLTINRMELVDEKCPLQKIKGQDALVRLSALALLTGRAQLGTVEIDHLDVQLTKDCGKSKTENRSTPSQGAQPSKGQPVSVKSQWKETALVNLFKQSKALRESKPFRKLRINTFEVLFSESLESRWSAQGRLDLKLSDQLSGLVKIEKAQWKEAQMAGLSSDWRFSMTDEAFKMQSELSVREGDVAFDFSVLNQKSFPSTVNLQFVKLPISPFTLLFGVGSEVRYLWLNCSLSLKNSWEKLGKTPIVTDKCLVEGPYGAIAINDLSATLESLEKIDFELNKLNLDKILKEKRSLYFSGILANYGVLSAKISYQKSFWKGQGYLENSEFVFSNNNLRDIQKVIKLPFEFQGKTNQWSAKMGSLEIDNGVFDGELVVEKKAGGPVLGRVAIHKLKLNPQIYKLTLQSKPTDLRLYGRFKAEDRGLDSWSIMVATPKLESDLYTLNRLKIKGQGGKDKKAQIQVTVADGAVSSEGPLVPWMRPTHLEADWNSEKVEFDELSTQLEVYPNRKVTWKRGYVRLKNGWQLSSEGLRDESENVRAWLQWDRPDRKFMRWNYQGSFFSGQWAPETKWVKNWLNANPEFLKKHEAVSFTAASKGSFTEKVNKAGKKAIEKVKKVLRPKGVKKK